MNYIYLTPYSIRVSKVRTRDREDLDNFDNGADLKKIILDRLRVLDEAHFIEARQRAFYVENIIENKDGFSFLFYYGLNSSWCTKHPSHYYQSSPGYLEYRKLEGFHFYPRTIQSKSPR